MRETGKRISLQVRKGNFQQFQANNQMHFEISPTEDLMHKYIRSKSKCKSKKRGVITKEHPTKAQQLSAHLNSQ